MSRLMFSKEKIQELYKLKIKLSKDYDKNNDGNVDLFEEDSFMNLLNKHQKKIIEIDKKYVLDFIKINDYLVEKRENLNKILKSIKDFNVKKLKYLTHKGPSTLSEQYINYSFKF